MELRFCWRSIESIKRSFPIVRAVLGALVAQLSSVRAQMLSAPVLQNAFANGGFTVGADFGTGSDLRSYGAAVSWAPLTAKYQVSGGIAYLDPKIGSGTATYGARLMVPVLNRTLPYGVAPFVGM